MSESFSEQKLDRLQAFILEHLEASGGMPIDVMHGYLSSLLSGPRAIMPNEWLPLVLGTPSFRDELEAEEVTGLVMAFYASVQEELASGKYGPLIIYKPAEDDGDPLPLPYGWCEGYLMGWGMHGDEAREMMLKDEEAANQLAPVMAFMMYENEQLLDPPEEEAHREAAAQLGVTVLSLYHWWQPHRDIPIQ